MCACITGVRRTLLHSQIAKCWHVPMHMPIHMPAHVPVPHACTTCLYHMPVPHACTACMCHMPVPHACTACLYHMPEPCTCTHASAHARTTTQLSACGSHRQDDPGCGSQVQYWILRGLCSAGVQYDGTVLGHSGVRYRDMCKHMHRTDTHTETGSGI